MVLDETSVFEESKTQGIMRDLAASLSTIEDASIANISVAQQRYTILYELNKLKQLAEELQQVDVSSDSTDTPQEHVAISSYLENLSTQVDGAIISISQPSPDFYIAGRLAGACMACHEDLWHSP